MESDLGGPLALGALLLSILALGCSDDWNPVSTQMYSAHVDSTLSVGDSSILEISGFAGNVSVTPGSPNLMHVVVTKWARREADLDSIDVTIVSTPNGVHVSTDVSPGLRGVSADIDVTIPMNARPALQVGAGNIVYEGQAEGESFFATGAGNITLRLPDDVNVAVHLSVGAGTIRVEFPVVGQVSNHLVDGVIGTGANGVISAQTGAGNIILVPF